MHHRKPLPILTGFVVAQDRDSGGIFQYSEAMRDALEGLAERGWISRPSLIHRKLPRSGIQQRDIPLEPPSVRTKVRDWILSSLTPTSIDRLRAFRPLPSESEDQRPVNQAIFRWLSEHGIDLLIFPGPDRFAFQAGIPSVMAIHDLQHRLQPEFPEVSVGGQWEAREFLYRNAARGALILVVDSEVGKEDVLRFYGSDGATEDRVEVLPFVPSPGLRQDLSEEEIKAAVDRFLLPERFLLYPAQFWPHKNHLRVVEALARLPSDVHLVLCGSNSGRLRKQTFTEVLRHAVELQLSSRLHYVGYVSDLELSALYSRAVALVFPTFFGPTNIPIIEAWKYELPVVTSRIRGITEQVGDAAILVDPTSVEEIASGIEVVWTDEGERKRLTKAGKAKLALYTPDDHRRRLLEILTKADRLLR